MKILVIANDWLGNWATTWSSPTGDYSAHVIIDHLAGVEIGGSYTGGDGGKGKISGSVSQLSGEDVYVMRGKWAPPPRNW